ncbi:helix-turn-helix domain-containing protein [Nocardia sp. NPDC023852]|uniref:helix-turn-helix domain-containing protein n=1 Tax=Nocardia sp. NPDC023852 TaxID=3154697 RepID=UPI0033FD447C
MRLRYNFRLYPSVGQQRSLAKAFGGARVVYNDALRARREAFEAGQRISDGELSKRLTESKHRLRSCARCAERWAERSRCMSGSGRACVV